MPRQTTVDAQLLKHLIDQVDRIESRMTAFIDTQSKRISDVAAAAEGAERSTDRFLKREWQEHLKEHEKVEEDFEKRIKSLEEVRLKGEGAAWFGKTSWGVLIAFASFAGAALEFFFGRH